MSHGGCKKKPGEVIWEWEMIYSEVPQIFLLNRILESFLRENLWTFDSSM